MDNQQNSLYLKIARELKEEIESYFYKLGDLMPTELELERRFKTSKTTIRNAISILEKEGYVKRKQGKGTIIQDIKPTQSLNYITSFTETLKEKGIRVETGGLTVRKITPPFKVISALNISENDEVYLVQRTRIADGVPIAFMNNYIIASVVPNLNRKIENLKEIGLYQLLEQEYNLKFDKAIEKFNVYVSGPLESEILQLTEKIPLFHSVRTTFLDNGKAFEYVISIIRTDKFEYTVYLKGRPEKK